MALHHSPRIVTDGLVLALDAGDRNSYVSGSATWRDLSTSANNGSLVSGPTYDSSNGGSIVFNGINQYTISTYEHSITGSNPWTISVWANVSSSESGSGRQGWLIWEGGTNQSTNQLIAMGINNGYIEMAHWGANDVVYPNAIVTFDNWSMYTCTYDGITERIYVNGIQRGSGLFTLLTTTGSWYLCSRANVTEFLNSKIATFNVYYRALSATEVLQNYNATKTRFGL